MDSLVKKNGSNKFRLLLWGYGSTFIYNENSKIQSYTLDEIKNKYNLKFNVLVADCEGFLEVFF